LPFWAEALATAVYLINRRPCRATGTATAYALLFGVPPTYAELRVFGCRCFPNLIATSPHKLAARSTPCIFIGYPADHRGYRCYNIATGRVITSRHVTFDENVFPFRDNARTHDADIPSSPCQRPTSVGPCDDDDYDAPRPPPSPPSTPMRLVADLTPHP
jgi:histone deacetylase 1/2